MYKNCKKDATYNSQHKYKNQRFANVDLLMTQSTSFLL